MKTAVTIGIIGGTGGMGRLFEGFFKRCGHRVLIAGRFTELTYADLARQCQVVILSTPLKAAIPIIQDIGPLLREDQLLMDFCSLKEAIVQAMLTHSAAQVVGTHPLFGPFTSSLKRQNIILCPARVKDWLDWCTTTFQQEGAIVTCMEAAEHDRNMAVVQGLTHFITICMGRTLMKLNIQPRESLRFATPLFRLKLDLIGRLFAQDLELFSSLVGENENVGPVLDTFFQVVDESRTKMFEDAGRDQIAYLQGIRDFLGDFCAQALKESNQFMETLYLQEENGKF